MGTWGLFFGGSHAQAVATGLKNRVERPRIVDTAWYLYTKVELLGTAGQSFGHAATNWYSKSYYRHEGILCRRAACPKDCPAVLGQTHILFLPEYGVRGLEFRPSNTTFVQRYLAVSMRRCLRLYFNTRLSTKDFPPLLQRLCCKQLIHVVPQISTLVRVCSKICCANLWPRVQRIVLRH